MIYDLEFSRQVIERLEGLSYPAYLCAMWASCGRLLEFDRSSWTEPNLALAEQTLDLVRAAAVTGNGELEDKSPAHGLVALWAPLTEPNQLDSFEPATGCLICTLEDLACELAARRPRHTALGQFTNVSDLLEEQWSDDLPTITVLTGRTLDPNGFKATELNRVLQLCQYLEERLAAGRSCDPEDARQFMDDLRPANPSAAP
jgi:hypothetical protein